MRLWVESDWKRKPATTTVQVDANSSVVNDGNFSVTLTNVSQPDTHTCQALNVIGGGHVYDVNLTVNSMFICSDTAAWKFTLFITLHFTLSLSCVWLIVGYTSQLLPGVFCLLHYDLLCPKSPPLLYKITVALCLALYRYVVNENIYMTIVNYELFFKLACHWKIRVEQ